jgi:hypothetical protein
MLKGLAVLGVALVFAATPVVAQGKELKRYRVTNDRALLVTREVLEKQGYQRWRSRSEGATSSYGTGGTR